MSREVTVEELKEKLDELLAEVENGESVTIVKDGHSIAQFASTAGTGGVPYPFRNFDFGSRPKNLKTDAAEIIIAERERERSGLKYKL
ncbi:MAG TPA: type II toxin-antitoxin system prevent-host-death family antitoxin [Thermoanaerobaculia bacterium]|jgi:antitoxin (DNA-binding transcriptional repressor) of toxin-antitoxin stability system|nr:type II toxin-antitoxin system prevent-host-death family antitoxin [Thermoanaerobaculia bacterium]